MKRISALVFLLLSASAFAQEPFTNKITFSLSGPRDLNPRFFSFSPEVVFDEKEKIIRFAGSTLLANETGTTDHHQSEALTSTTLAKVQFHVDVPPREDGELFLYGNAKEINVNGTKLDATSKLYSTGWSRVRVPGKVLKSGINEVILGGGGSLLVEPSRPGKSFKSIDGGKTWLRETLTGSGDVSGEYLVRLRLPQHAKTGWAMTHPIDLWTDIPIASPRTVDEVRLNHLAKQPVDTSVRVLMRQGDTPTPRAGKWSEWGPLPEKGNLANPGARWLQLKFELETHDANESPRIPAELALSLKGTRSTLPASTIRATMDPPHDRHITSGPAFIYQKPHARLEHLRKRYKLDEVIAPGKTEMEQFMLLRYWVRNQWHTGWQGHPAQWMPPWDALIILDCKDQPECLTMCTHYGAVFAQCCQALGWNARHCILDHHCVSEVYSFEKDRWIMMDTGNSAQRADVGLHFERKGIPLSARELHLAYQGKDLDGITVHFTPWDLSKKIQHLCREAPKGKSDPSRPDVIPLNELKKFPVCQIENYRRYAFPGRNTYLTSLYPGELYQGYSPYFYDGYWWVGDSLDNPLISPEYSRLIDPRREDADWKLGGTRVHLSRKMKGQVQVDLESLMPNHAKFERFKDKGWVTTPGRFDVSVGDADSVLRVRSVNMWGKAGKESTVRMEKK